VTTPTPVIARELSLPSGNTVTFRDPEELTGQDHRTIVDQMRADVGLVGASMDAVYGTACMLIESWTFDAPLPREDPSQLGKLKFRDYNAIVMAITPAAQLLFGSEPSPDQAGTPGSPTEPSSG
jgi:hypothetical protein